MRRLPTPVTLAIVSACFATPLFGQLQASATFSATQVNSTTYHYEILVKNTGTTNIDTFWFAWMPGVDYMPSAPSNIGAPLYWTGTPTHAGASDGYGILWTTPYAVYGLSPGQSFNSFSFDSAMTPAQLNGTVGTSFVYIGGPQGDPGYSFVVTSAAGTTPLLSVGSSHVGSFTAGQPGATYNLTVRNNGSAASTGAVTLTDTLPAGFVATAMSGTGWNCSATTLTCTRSDSLAAGASYPTIALAVNVSPSGVTPVANQVNLTGGGSAAASAIDNTTVLQPFADIALGDNFLPYVDLLREYGITGGCGTNPPIFCPGDNITRGQMAVFVVRAVIGGDNFTYNQTPYFNDVPAGNSFFQWIQKMRDLGITSGCGSNNYCPNDPVTRGQMAVFIIRTRLGSTATFNYPTTPLFTDVTPDNPFFLWIQKMKQLGITSGCGGTDYCPNDPVTREQMAVFLMRGAFNQLLPAGTPVVSALSPSAGPRGYNIMVTLTGQNTNWVNGTTQVTASPGITVSNVVVTSPTTLTAQVNVPAGATPGPYSLTATTGTEEATIPNGFTVQ